MLPFSDVVHLPVWIVVIICIISIIVVYVKNIGIFLARKQSLRLVVLSIIMLIMCSLFVIMAYNYYN